MLIHGPCASCGIKVLTSRVVGPDPIGYETCPECGEAEFEFIEE